MLWAAIFLRFGLLPTILLHALFDLALFSIPLFLVDAPGAWLAARAGLRGGARAARRRAVAASRGQARGANCRRRCATARGCRAPPRRRACQVARARSCASRVQDLVQRALPYLGLAGLAAWIAFTPMRGRRAAARRSIAPRRKPPPTPRLPARGVTLGPEWRRFSTVRQASDDAQWTQHKFVWREAGPEAYRALVGTTLAPPLWEVRYAMFEGDVAERAEEWRVTIEPDGEVRQMRHLLPEARPGRATVEGCGAGARRASMCASASALDPARLTLVAADEKDRPARTDWTFVFADPRVDVGKDGEARTA